MLTAIKLLHTAIWAFLAATIFALPVLGVLRRFRWAAILSVIVLLECGIVAVNGGGCPLNPSCTICESWRHSEDSTALRGRNWWLTSARWQSGKSGFLSAS